MKNFIDKIKKAAHLEIETEHEFPPLSYDSVHQPKHYLQHASGIECIEITEHFNFCIGNAIKYLWRSDHKNGIEDLRKAVWYIEREIERRSEEL